MSECYICNKSIENNINFSNVISCRKIKICLKCNSMLVKVKKGCKMCCKQTDKEICDDCFYWERQSINIKNYSLYYYNEFTKSIINKIKFSGDCRVLDIFKDDIKNLLKNIITKKYLTIPVPLHEDRLLERGFNQSLYICKMLPYKIIDVISKKNNDKQSKKNKLERLSLNNFYYNSNINLENKKVIIIDDIYTTGATIHNIAEILIHKKVKEIISFTLFRS